MIPAYWEKTIDNVKKVFIKKREGKKTFLIKFITYIVRRYVELALDAVQNGYMMKIRSGPRIYLEMQEARKLNKREKTMYLMSDRHFGYMFKFTIEFRHHYEKFDWIPTRERKQQLQAILNSDIIYDLIKT